MSRAGVTTGAKITTGKGVISKLPNSSGLGWQPLKAAYGIFKPLRKYNHKQKPIRIPLMPDPIISR